MDPVEGQVEQGVEAAGYEVIISQSRQTGRQGFQDELAAHIC